MEPSFEARLDMLEAKIDLLLRRLGIVPPTPGAAMTGVSPEVEGLILRDQMVRAVKQVREETALPLVEAKRLVDRASQVLRVE